MMITVFRGFVPRKKLARSSVSMAGRGRRRRNKRASTKREILPAGPTSVHHIPDHLLELVLLRVDSSLALLRAAFACKRWRRIIADTAFLARFRSLHPPHVPGHYHVVDPSYRDRLLPEPDRNNRVFVPDPSTAGAIDRRHFSLDFLPNAYADSSYWELADSRGSLLLLYRQTKNRTWQLRFPDLVVCDPLSRRYQGITYPPEMRRHLCFGAFLLDGTAVDETGGCHYTRYPDCWHFKVPLKATKLPVKPFKGRMISATLSRVGKCICWQFSKVPAMFKYR
jgi:hypothetical protein